MFSSRASGWKSRLCVLLLAGLTVSCSGEPPDETSGQSGEKGSRASAEKGKGRGQASGGGRPGGPGGFGAEGGGSRGVPVEVASVGRETISLFFETHGTLEAENEVDLVARVAGPILELNTEEGRRVRKGDVLARIDDRELVTQLEVARIRLEESEKSYERVKNLFEKELISRDAYDQAFASFGAAKGEVSRLEVQLEHTRIIAPFSGLVVQRYVKFAEHLQNGARLFRLSDFDPLLCPILVPERELARLKVGQRAELTVESYDEQRFDARVLRISPIVDAASGTVKVTLRVDGQDRLRPGMFANVFLELANRPEALVVPKSALALDSLGNTVYVAADGVAQRRDLELGFRNDDLLEVVSGIEEGEQVVVVGQDGLSDGTPIEILERRGAAGDPPAAGQPTGGPSAEGPAQGRGPGFGGPGGRGGPGGGFFRNLDFDDPEQVERVKTMLRQRGLTDAEIDERLKRIKERRAQRGQG